MSDTRAIAIYNRLADTQARLVQSQARLISIATAIFSNGPVGAQKSSELIDAATAMIPLNNALLAAMASILQKQADTQTLDTQLQASNLSGNVPRQTVYDQFGDQIDVINVEMTNFVGFRDSARQNSTQITALAQQSKLSTGSESSVGPITGIVGVNTLPPLPGNPPPPPVPPPVLQPPPTPPPNTTGTPPPVGTGTGSGTGTVPTGGNHTNTPTRGPVRVLDGV